MKRFFVGVIFTLAIVLIFRSCSKDNERKSILKENSMLIQEQINNVSKLIVTEGHFAEVYNYKDSQQLFGPLITAHKKALVVVNAEVIVAYDLSLIKFEIDGETKTLRIKDIPAPEIKINPDFEYYDVTSDYLNQFDAEDYNKIKRNINTSLLKKIEASSLRSNAENRLLSELSKFLVLTNSMGWTLTYGDRDIQNFEELKLLD
ncbi:MULTISPECIES: DUF4230 domain-containing protein [unclassified Arenibacter]|jgi:hypothetical protein|uniref:DUF4230 domain-containing protein n=1 Tax=unclassified Arenibacter TaxID=2615047 RepID=UPI000E34A2D6|nr:MULTISPECIES: DUF4230 domain-containing protein [unclassified Arenibacter]MCM4163568.1 hypothetical protein [Arenibacter sp. A80]RFT56299.1 DUF4230 domain-containing protein [Arenibacter sp. P308M17]